MSKTVIKSVGRVFEILELFDKRRQALSAKDVSKTLNYPLNSAHALLKSMLELGYLEFNEVDWSYVPSTKFVNVLDWLEEYLERDSNIIEFMHELNQKTEETINLSRGFDTKTKFIQGLNSIHPVGISVRIGLTMPAVQSLTGITSLAAMDNKELADFLQHPDNVDADLSLIESVLQEIKDRGTTCRTDLFVKGIGAVCLPVLTHENRILVVGVVGPSERVIEQQKKYRKQLKQLVAKHGIKTLYKIRN